MLELAPPDGRPLSSGLAVPRGLYPPHRLKSTPAVGLAGAARALAHATFAHRPGLGPPETPRRAGALRLCPKRVVGGVGLVCRRAGGLLGCHGNV